VRRQDGLLFVEGWWFVHVQETDEQGWAPASHLLPENREKMNEVADPGNRLSLADLERSRAGSAPPPPLGDGLTPSLTVMLANAKF